MHRAIAVSMMLVFAACPRASEPEAVEPTSAPRDPAEQQRGAIAATVAGYDDALSARDPAAAASWVVSATFGFYDDLLALALAGRRSELEQRSVMEIFMVLDLRSRYSRAELEQANGRALFEAAVAAGMPAAPLALGELRIDESGNRAEIQIEGEPPLWLAREQGRWLIDVPTMIVKLAALLEADLVDEIRADGKLRVAFALLEQESQHGLDVAMLEGPLEAVR